MLLAVFCLVFCSAALADQEGNSRWCNSDQYGCWITGEDSGQNYIMFWSESARNLFMGPDSKAGVVKQYPTGKMPLDPAPEPAPVPAPAPAPVNPVNPKEPEEPEEPENPEEELTTSQKVEAIVAYVLENHLFDYEEENIVVTQEMCDSVVETVSEYDGFSEAVDNVYNMISEGQEKEDIGIAIGSFIYE